ncbi:group II intron reverse transcriptase/maturase [Mangrovibacillus sp. Mu-81]|uniref:group II intron reverse transcriptase/maturase n=1 Tax=Mangrovibacillus sp. Mu-81 TaxID=3121478 RepID=UPI002FE4DCF2
MKQNRKYYSLIDKVYKWSNLLDAWKAVKVNRGNGGIDGITIEKFEIQPDMYLREIQRLLKENRYEPDPVLRTYIEKDNGKLRPLGIPTIRDRVTQQAVRQVIEPIFEKHFYNHSYGFRKGRSAHQAIDIIRRAKRAGYNYVLDLDIQSFFDEIPHEELMKKVNEKISDGRVLNLLSSWLTAGIMEDDQFHESKIGSPQGGVISPLLANIYLNHYDWEMQKKGFSIVRYADDAVVLCKSRLKANQAYKVSKHVIEEELHLRMHPEKTKVVHFDEGFRFLGLDFWSDFLILPNDKVKKLKEKVRRITRRQQGRNVKQMIYKVNEVVRGFGNYYRVGNVKKKFTRLDQWIRMRIRAFIRKKRSTVSNSLIPNKVLKLCGLVSLESLLITSS